tara:strand:+ start:1074 stop:1538 length:465 start_codon:yes stop_codon:yes gene_type:complete
MESMNSASDEPQTKVDPSHDLKQELSDQWFNEKFERLLPRIQREWPDVAKQTLEATKGSLDELIQVISKHSGNSNYGVEEKLEEIFNAASDKTKDIAHTLEPLEQQLEDLLDDLNTTLRPKIEKPIRSKPLVAIGIATGVGLLLGILIAGGRRN